MRPSALSPSGRSRAAKCMYTVALDSGVMAGTPTISNAIASPKMSFPGSMLRDSSNVSSPRSTPMRSCVSIAAQCTKAYCGTSKHTILPNSPCSPHTRYACLNPSYSTHNRTTSDTNGSTAHSATFPAYTPKSRVGMPKYCSYDSLFSDCESFCGKKDFTESMHCNVIPTKDPNNNSKTVGPGSFSDNFPETNTTVRESRDITDESHIVSTILMPPRAICSNNLSDLSSNTAHNAHVTHFVSTLPVEEYHPLPTTTPDFSNPPQNELGFFYRACAWTPHPEKVASGGEDSFMCTDTALGVADGIGWWASNQSKKKELAEIRANDIQKERKTKREQKNNVKPTDKKLEVKTRQTLSGGSVFFDDAKSKTMSDSQQYSELFMRAAFDFVEDEYLGQGQVPVSEMVKYAYRTVHEDYLGEKDPLNDCPLDDDTVTTKEVGGSATVLFATIVHDVLEVYTLGDCKLMLIRNGKVNFQSEDQVHDLNFPFQLGVGSKDRPEDGIVSHIKVRPGDLVILGSDGIFDNVFVHDIIKILKDIVATDDEFLVKGPQGIVSNKRYQPLALSTDDFAYRLILNEELRSPSSRMRSGVLCQSLLQKASQRILQLAKSVAADPRADTPFAAKCLESGVYYEGGKEDDMTLVMAMITQSMEGEGLRAGGSDTGLDFPPFYKNWP